MPQSLTEQAPDQYPETNIISVYLVAEIPK